MFDEAALRNALTTRHVIREIYVSRITDGRPVAWVVSLAAGEPGGVVADGFSIAMADQGQLTAASQFHYMSKELATLNTKIEATRIDVAALNTKIEATKIDLAATRVDVARIIEKQEHPFANGTGVARNGIGSVFLTNGQTRRFLGTGTAVCISGDKRISGTFLRRHMVFDYLPILGSGLTIVIKYANATPYQLFPGPYVADTNADLIFVRGVPEGAKAVPVEEGTGVEPGTRVLLSYMRRSKGQSAEFSCVTGSVNGGDSGRPLLNAPVAYGCCAGVALSCVDGAVRLVGILGERAAPEVHIREADFETGGHLFAAMAMEVYQTLMTEIVQPTACVGSAIVYDFLKGIGQQMSPARRGRRGGRGRRGRRGG
jgi:hypothetical protein